MGLKLHGSPTPTAIGSSWSNGHPGIPMASPRPTSLSQQAYRPRGRRPSWWLCSRLTSQRAISEFRWSSTLVRSGSLYDLCWPDHVKLVYRVERLGCPVSLASAMLEQLGQYCLCTKPEGRTEMGRIV